MLLKDSNAGRWAGNFVYDENVVEKGRSSSGSARLYALVPGYPGVMQHKSQPSIRIGFLPFFPIYSCTATAFLPFGLYTRKIYNRNYELSGC